MTGLAGRARHSREALRHLSRIVDLRPGELSRVGGMFSLLGLIIAASYILKPVRSSIFLSQFGSERLPYVYILVALVLGVVAGGFARLSLRVNLTRLFTGLALFFSGNLVVFWLAIREDWPFVGFVFYIWVSIFTALMPSLFWLLANYVFYSNEGRRLFPLVMAGGLLGSITGGALTSLFVPLLGTSGLLLSAALLLLGIALLIRWNAEKDRGRVAERRAELQRQERRHAAQAEESTFRLVGRSRYTRMLALLMLVTSTASTLVDFQFNTVVEQSYDNMDALTGFFGTFFAAINVIAFFLQLIVAPQLLNRLGVAAGLLALPLTLFGSSLAFVLLPGLVTASLIKTSDDGLSNSLNKASVEILYLPISLVVKNRLKAWLDMFVERMSRGLGGLTILVATSLFGLSVSQMGLIVLTLLIPWIVLAVLLQREYVKTFRDSLSRREIGDVVVSLDDPQSLSVVEQILSSMDEKQLVYALELLQGTDNALVLKQVAGLTSHPDPAVRASALRLLRAAAEPPPVEHLSGLVEDQDIDVSAEAIALLAKADPESGRATMAALFRSNDPQKSLAVLNCFEWDLAPLVGVLQPELVVKNRSSPDELRRTLAAKAIGLLPEEAGVAAYLPELIADESLEVTRAAAGSAGRLQYRPAIPVLLTKLKRRATRGASARALARMGPEIVGQLSRKLLDRELDRGLRVAVPHALAEFEDQAAVDALLELLPQEDPHLHYAAIKALGKMRARFDSLRFSRREVDRLLDEERGQLVEWARRLSALETREPRVATHRLLIQVLEERFSFTLERLFRLLGLQYPPTDLFNVFDRIVKGRPSVRAAALEYLSNLFTKRHRESLLPLLEADGWQEVWARGARLTGHAPASLTEAIRCLILSPDRWVAACAITLSRDLGLEELRASVQSRRQLAEPFIQAAVGYALDKRT